MLVGDISRRMRQTEPAGRSQVSPVAETEHFNRRMFFRHDQKAIILFVHSEMIEAAFGDFAQRRAAQELHRAGVGIQRRGYSRSATDQNRAHKKKHFSHFYNIPSVRQSWTAGKAASATTADQLRNE
ncbi:hypothetical protein JUN65_03450 [Gluconacetobacter azotocaptans]|uniref:hypothetical protein n=1 Tax=Gluconacetobacter azotocaptans TaxID=142834 RepID=UPI00195897AF|nr:hypothetical protein [Gluconacetobacter azotocaptans]MBM9400648.1 hypothetical protein [Gluconacetobacter azotocaptans]